MAAASEAFQGELDVLVNNVGTNIRKVPARITQMRLLTSTKEFSFSRR